MATIEELKGKTLIAVDGLSESSTEVLFATSDGKKFKMFHEQDCCESVYISEIAGDVADLIGSPILLAEEVHEERDRIDPYNESWTWTFYKIATIKGYVDIRWYGTSNGYYSESVSFIGIEK